MKVERYKNATCIECGKPIQIHIYASASKARCDECKSGRHGKVSGSVQTSQGDLKPLSTHETQGKPHGRAERHIGTDLVTEDDLHGPRIDHKPNLALQNLCCPFHHDMPMKIIGVINSPIWGDLVDLQCRHPGCWTRVTISQQNTKMGPVRTTGSGDGFEPDQSPEEILERLRTGEITNEWLFKLRNS